jgi:5'-nucleotidase
LSKESAVKLATTSLVVLALVTAFGCQQQKKPDASTMDLSGQPTVTAAATPTAAPAAYAPPVQTPAADAALSTSTPSTSLTASGNSYTIKPGDTLWKIASTHYGDGRKWHQIADANPGLTPSKLRVGQTIALP